MKSSMVASRGTRSGYQYEGGQFFCKHDGVRLLSTVRGGTGLKIRNDAGFSDLLVVLKHFFDELGDRAFWSVGMTVFYLRGEGS